MIGSSRRVMERLVEMLFQLKNAINLKKKDILKQ